MKYDISKLLIYSVFTLAGVGLILSLRARLRDYKILRYFLAVGSIFFFGSVLINSSIEKNWSREFIIDYLLIKDVGLVGLRKTILFAYACYTWAFLIFVLVKINMRVRSRALRQDEYKCK
jgi:hypothetical protein